MIQWPIHKEGHLLHSWIVSVFLYRKQCCHGDLLGYYEVSFDTSSGLLYFYLCIVIIIKKQSALPKLLKNYIHLHLSDAFIQSDLQLHSDYTFLISTCVPWESNPQPFALLTQCSTTEPHRNTYIALYSPGVSKWIFGGPQPCRV